MDKVNHYKIAVIGNHSLELGFKIAGIASSHVVETTKEAEDLVNQFMQQDDIGIIVLTSTIAREIHDRKINDAMQNSMKPIFIVVADLNDKEVYEDNLRKLIIRALGIDIMKTRQ